MIVKRGNDVVTGGSSKSELDEKMVGGSGKTLTPAGRRKKTLQEEQRMKGTSLSGIS